MTVYSDELENFSFQYLNAQWRRLGHVEVSSSLGYEK